MESILDEENEWINNNNNNTNSSGLCGNSNCIYNQCLTGIEHEAQSIKISRHVPANQLKYISSIEQLPICGQPRNNNNGCLNNNNTFINSWSCGNNNNSVSNNNNVSTINTCMQEQQSDKIYSTTCTEIQTEPQPTTDVINKPTYNPDKALVVQRDRQARNTEQKNQSDRILNRRSDSSDNSDDNDVINDIIQAQVRESYGYCGQCNVLKNCPTCRYCNQCDALKQKLKLNETEKNSLQTLVNELLNNQTHLENNNNQLQKEKMQYLEQCNTLKADKISLMEQLITNKKEFKETKLELNDIKKELNKLKRLKNIDVGNYLKWKSDDFVDWIISLENGKYEQYEEKLRFIFKQEYVNGEAIPCIDKSELKGWGIQNFMDRQILHQHIKNLANQNKQNINNNTNDEGHATAYI